MARKSPLAAIGTQCRHRPGECTRRATEATRYRCLATRAEPTRGFAEGAKSVESSEELAPEKLHAVEPHTLKRLFVGAHGGHQDRKSTRLNSSHSQISYAVFCLKTKK